MKEENKIELHPVEPYLATWHADIYEHSVNVVIDAEERCEDWDFVRYRATLSDDRKFRQEGRESTSKRGKVVYLFPKCRGTWPATKGSVIVR